MIDMVHAETPQEIQHQEDWINRTLQPDYPGIHVCLHADTTTTVDKAGTRRRECDYCPTFVRAIPGVPLPPMPPYYWNQ